MKQNWYLVFSYALGASFLISLGATAVLRRLAIRWNVMDLPGERKMHPEPVPLLGGAAIFGTFCAVILGSLLLIEPARRIGFDWLDALVLAFLGTNVKVKLAGIFAGGLIVFVLGLVDDVKTLRPEAKFAGQVAAALLLVASGTRLDLFIENVWAFSGLRPEGSVPTLCVSGLATILWVVMMTNAMNFLDNMDGLCGGVSLIAAFSFFLCVLPHEEYFVCVMLLVFAGSVAGFLYHNLHPARIFMGDAGSMFCGYILATVAVLGTFYTETTPSRVAVAAPLVALSVPIFDIGSVIYIRWRNGQSIIKGDKRHFSHRLVAIGMSPRQAVEFILLVAAVVGLGAALLPKVGRAGTLIVLAQTAGLFMLIVILMNAGQNRQRGLGK
ncbi:MAG TPA: undecaprenyl/decaprenyl-phosphate alpha-N-acetylglucosaminyl 1-phosphate transferase [Candidatus Hydrogenedentes bacterium]|nr:undecaprenyl/decaprenyl-phosphate alpha-N-acetylglucosaminyl 1-phosphate transferase [Candidatus Hydrogenedentota bacterium]HIJ73912.1 undecaprenyl/decaprenyl-phosphate alpha-N-acetylglucosaminyl 1-phosphate transferase [Candidatus Hydrogenedentota bacterium]